MRIIPQINGKIIGNSNIYCENRKNDNLFIIVYSKKLKKL